MQSMQFGDIWKCQLLVIKMGFFLNPNVVVLKLV